MIEFVEHNGTYRGVDARSRVWRITPVVAGWRLEYRVSGERTSWRAGVFGDLVAAKREADREY
jgi:hypothetical protein